MTEMQYSDMYFAIYKISVVLIKDLKCQSELWISLKVYCMKIQPQVNILI